MDTVTGSRTATVTLPSDEQILITREFEAPRRLVYRAYNESRPKAAARPPGTAVVTVWR